ncbi:9308_t:CDS:2, partial [Acaulospora colombiana]
QHRTSIKKASIFEIMTIELRATQSKVHSVTVFQADRAEVTRLFTVDLKAGQNEVDISQLPTVLDEDSIRVDGIGHNAIISDVIYHPPKSNDSDKKHEEAVKELQRERKALEQQLEVFNKQAEILQKYSDTLKGADTTGAQLNEFLDLYAERQSGIDVKSTEINDKIAEVDKKIKREREIWDADTEGKKRAVRITVIVYAEEDGTAEISLTYREREIPQFRVYQPDTPYTVVSNASWTPLYDLRAAISPNKTDITLQYRATIVQSTGEDWKEVYLTLSTASPQLGSAIPKLSPQWLNPIVQYYAKNLKKGGFGRGSNIAPSPSMNQMPAPGGVGVALSSLSYDAYGGEGGSTLGAAFAVPEALAIEGTISTSYIIEGLSTIPSDTDLTAQAHKVTVAVVDLAADLEWITVPKDTPSAFLQAKVKNTSQYLFLPGRANIFLDDNFVAKSAIDHVSPGETFHCSLGVDPQVKLTYHPRTKKARSQGGLLTTRTTSFAYHQKITIKNTRTTTIKRLVVRDQIPVSGDQRIKVALVEPSQIEFAGRNTIGGSTGGSLSKLSSAGEKLMIPKETKISKSVSVRWKVADEDELAAEGLDSTSGLAGADGAREGMLEWICEISNGQSVDLTLAWE